jgi:DNA-binding MltR family transcriptional regulator
VKYDPNSPEALQRVMTLVEEMNDQSDRGAAIVGAAWLEESISAALESFLHSHPKSWERLLGGNGPLGTFSAKIDLSRLLGLTTDAIWSDLHILRDIRNQFAHQVAHKTDQSKLNFKTPHIRDKCLALRCVQHEDIEEPRTAFVRSCAILYSDFEMIAFFGIKAADGGHIFARSERGS